MKGKKLSPKQHAFVEYYAACGNATEAARQAGYKNPNVQGSQNLEKPSIQQAIAALTEHIASKRIADAQERQEFWTALMRGEDKYRKEEGGEGKAIEAIEMKDRLKASELLGKAQQDFIEKVDLCETILIERSYGIG